MTRTPATDPPPLTTRLDRDWARLRRHRRSLEQARTWDLPLGDRPASRITDLQTVIDSTQHDRPGHNARLGRLVELAHDDDLARRTVLQRLLPGLVSGAWRHHRRFPGEDVVELAIPVAWEVIGRYDVARRPGHVAASLISDTVDRTFRRPVRRRSLDEVSWSPERFVETTHAALAADNGCAFDELVALLRSARDAGVRSEHVELFGALLDAGSPGALAERRRVTPRTIRNHRDRAVARIRHALEIDAPDRVGTAA